MFRTFFAVSAMLLMAACAGTSPQSCACGASAPTECHCAGKEACHCAKAPASASGGFCAHCDKQAH